MALPPHETRITPAPSLPPSPTLFEGEEEPGRVHASPAVWNGRSAEKRVEFAGAMRYSEQSSSSGSVMGVSRAEEKESNSRSLDEQDDDDDEDDEDTIENHGGSSHEVYPPTTDAAAETRRVEETLKRWELAERQRRKLARESSQMSTGPSLFGDVTRKASLILSRRTTPSHRRTSVSGMGMGNHQALKSRESIDGYVVPLDEIDPNSPSAIPVHSPTPSVLRNSVSSESQNPFIHPSELLSRPSPSPSPTLVSPFVDAKERTSLTSHSAVARASSSLESASASASSTNNKTQTRPTTLPPPKTLVPPPLPLGLPPPVTPPPPGEASHMVPLRPTPPPVLSPPPPSLVEPEERREVRWWHDWLCGCGEGSDRGGDSQAGRTNPFE